MKLKTLIISAIAILIIAGTAATTYRPLKVGANYSSDGTGHDGTWLPMAGSGGVGTPIGRVQPAGLYYSSDGTGNDGTWLACGLNCFQTSLPNTRGCLQGFDSNPCTLAQSGIPVIIAPNGTIASSGIVTLGTALAATYPFAWFYFPAGAVTGGAAGVYYATCTSTTSCQIYTNYVNPATTPFSPSVPASPSAATGSGSAYTQTTAAQLPLINTAVTAGALGTQGSIRKRVVFGYINNADTKTTAVNFGGQLNLTSGVTTTATLLAVYQFANAGDAAHQLIYPAITVSAGASSGIPTAGTVNTANAQALTVTCQLAVATDYCLVYQNTDEMLPK